MCIPGLKSYHPGPSTHKRKTPDQPISTEPCGENCYLHLVRLTVVAHSHRKPDAAHLTDKFIRIEYSMYMNKISSLIVSEF